MLSWTVCAACGRVSTSAFRVTQSISRMSGRSSVATVIGTDGQSGFGWSCIRAGPEWSMLCGVCVFREFPKDCRDGWSSTSPSQHTNPAIKSFTSSKGVIPALPCSYHIFLSCFHHRLPDRVTVIRGKILMRRAVIDCLSLSVIFCINMRGKTWLHNRQSSSLLWCWTVQACHLETVPWEAASF